MSFVPEIFDLSSLSRIARHTRAVAVGNFDGVHRGHQLLLRALERGMEMGATKRCVLTFHPHPAVVLSPAHAPTPLCSLEDRVGQLLAAGADEVVVLRFDEQLSRLSPNEFARDVLAGGLQTRQVVVGENFRYASERTGCVDTLVQHGELYGFAVEAVPLLIDRGLPVSSSQIRKLLFDGQVSRAARLLGRPFTMEGSIVEGRGVGSKQTAPTLNLALPSTLIPADGVYVTRAVCVASGQTYSAVSNIGYRPTFQDGHPERSIETFVIGELHERPSAIQLQFLARLRDERKFATPEALRAQILRDVVFAQNLHRRVSRWRPAALWHANG